MVGHGMDVSAARQLIRLGGDPGDFQARLLDSSRLRAADLILTATRAHRGAVLEAEPRALRRTFTILEFADLVSRGSTSAGPAQLVADAARRRAESKVAVYDVADPIGGGDHIHEEVADLISRAVTTISAVLAQAVSGDR